MWDKLITPKLVIATTVAVSLVAAAAIGSIGVQSYVNARHHSFASMQAASELALHYALAAIELETTAEEKTAEAKKLFESSKGKTFDETARGALAKAIKRANIAVEVMHDDTSNMVYAVEVAQSHFDDLLWWPPSAHTSADALRNLSYDLSAGVDSALVEVAMQSAKVKEAQAAWQAEQDRIAAEEAARKAAEEAARLARQGGSMPGSGGSTSPNVQNAPPSSGAGASFAESYLRQFVSPAQANLAWNPNLCRVGQICGTTLLGAGVPLITLMGTPQWPANYNWSGGRYVIVHEAAHARAFWLYGSVSAMISNSERFTAPMGITGVAAIEYMADCATIAMIGYAGTYASSCTSAQLAEAARVW